MRYAILSGRVLDLGCAPGSWLQYASGRVGPGGRLVGIDRTLIELAVPGVRLMAGDVFGVEPAELLGELEHFDVVMSDMAAASSGHKGTDHIRIVALVEAAAAFAFDVLEPGGTFVAKVLAGGAETEMQAMLKRHFDKVANVKPPASRSDSSEKFVIATGFRGRQPQDDQQD